MSTTPGSSNTNSDTAPRSTLIEGNFTSTPPTLKGTSWSWALLVGCLLIFVALTVAFFWMRFHNSDPDAPQDRNPASVDQALPGIDISGLPVSRMAVVDIGAITVAWGASAASDSASAASDAAVIAAKLKRQLERLAQSGVVVIESRYSLASPAASDITTQVAASIGVDMKALLTSPVSSYANPTTPVVSEGTGWRTGPFAAPTPAPAADVKSATPSATKKVEPKGTTNQIDDD